MSVTVLVLRLEALIATCLDELSYLKRTQPRLIEDRVPNSSDLLPPPLMRSS